LSVDADVLTKYLQESMFEHVSEHAEAALSLTPDWLALKPVDWAAHADWQPVLDRFAHSPQWPALRQRLQAALEQGKTIYPPEPTRALALTALADVRVVILGQDPYHGPGQAEGLAFSVRTGQKIPPSLRNIAKEIARDLGVAWPTDAAGQPDGSLRRWAQAGVLLLNSCWTVEDASPASHSDWGWEALTRAVLQAVAERSQPCVWMLWGAHAQRLLPESVATPASQALVLRANHPSPLSANRPPVPFLGCSHFSQAQAYWRQYGNSLRF
jgi:uracil-DNA glycosylase